MNDGAGTRLMGAFVPALPEAHSRSAWIQNAGGLGGGLSVALMSDGF